LAQPHVVYSEAGVSKIPQLVINLVSEHSTFPDKRLSFARLSTCMLDLAKLRVEGGALAERRVSRLSFAKRSIWVLNLAKLRVEAGHTCKSRG